MPFTEELLEHCDWLAQRIGENGGEAWVLPVAQLSAREEMLVRERQRLAREREYDALSEQAGKAMRGSRGDSQPSRRTIDALEHGFRAVVGRDHFHAAGRARTRSAIERVLKGR